MRTAALALAWGVFVMEARSDEGMWLLDEPPRQLLKDKYGFDLTDDFLTHARLASIRFGQGGSASFVSPDGLVVTNHHVGSDAIAKVGTKDRNLLRDGFVAKTHADELKCPDIELNVLQEIVDVTDERERGRQAGDDAGPGVRRPPGRHGRHREGARPTRRACAATW